MVRSVTANFYVNYPSWVFCRIWFSHANMYTQGRRLGHGFGADKSGKKLNRPPPSLRIWGGRFFSSGKNSRPGGGANGNFLIFSSDRRPPQSPPEPLLGGTVAFFYTSHLLLFISFIIIYSVSWCIKRCTAHNNISLYIWMHLYCFVVLVCTLCLLLYVKYLLQMVGLYIFACENLIDKKSRTGSWHKNLLWLNTPSKFKIFFC